MNLAGVWDVASECWVERGPRQPREFEGVIAMNLIDLMVAEPEPVAEVAAVQVNDVVRELATGKVGEVLLPMKSSDRLCVVFPGEPMGRMVHGFEVEARTCPHPRWDKTITVWPDETIERLTITCVECGLIRGRA